MRLIPLNTLKSLGIGTEVEPGNPLHLSSRYHFGPNFRRRKERNLAMNHIDIRDLVVGLTLVVLLAVGLGQFARLHKFAMHQAELALRPWPSHPFFTPGYEIKVPHRN